MTWIFQPENSKSSPFSQDMGDSPWPADSPESGPGRSATSRTTKTPSRSCSNGSETASIPLPSGTTSRPSIPDPGEDTLTSSRPGSLASLTLKPEPVGSLKDLTMTGTSGPRRGRSFGWWDASGSCLRTYQASFNLEMEDGNLTASKFWGIFPYWGSMLGGEFIAQPTPERPISGSGGGSWPTPVADGDRTTNYQQGGTSLGFAARNPELWPTPRAGKITDEEEESWRARYEEGKVATPPLGLAVKMHHIPTPTTADVYTGNMASSQQSDGSMHSVNLPDYVKMWATPRVDDSKNNGSPSQQERHGPALNVQVKQMLPTPSSGGDSGGPHGIRGGSWAKEKLVETFGEEDAIAMSGGSLNPDWEEQHLMSLPEGWTRLEPVPNGAYQEWFDAMRDGTWWDTERGLPRVTTGAENRVNRLKMLGNGIVPASGALAIRDMMSWCWGTIDAGVTQEDAKRRGT